MMKKKEDCSKCYAQVKVYTPIRGFWIDLCAMLLLMIPILNLWILHRELNMKPKKHDKFYGLGLWYKYKEIPLKRR